MEIQNLIDSFEMHLRNFLIKKTIDNVKGPIENYFPQNLLKDLRKKAIKEMKQSKIDSQKINEFKISDLLNEDDLSWIFEQMSNKHYISFINHNISFLGNYLGALFYTQEVRTGMDGAYLIVHFDQYLDHTFTIEIASESTSLYKGTILTEGALTYEGYPLYSILGIGVAVGVVSVVSLSIKRRIKRR